MARQSRISFLIAFLTFLLVFSLCFPAHAQKKIISFATGGTGGVYFPLGGGMANVLSTYIPNLVVTAEVTAASVDNLKLIQAKKVELALTMADVAQEAWTGEGKFKSTGKMQGIRNIAVIYSNALHFVVLKSSGINSVSGLKGKRVSTGAPGSGTEVKAIRVLESYNVNADKDIKRERLSFSEGGGALKDRKIDCVTIESGLPNSVVLDLSATPGISVKILNNSEHIDMLIKKYGDFYHKMMIPKKTYPYMDSEVPVIGSANQLICHESMDPQLVYNILKVLFEHKAELVASHASAESLELATAVVGSAIPMHPGAVKFFKERNIQLK